MSHIPEKGFTEIPHTADWAIRVWAPDLQHLFMQAVTGMFTLMGIQTDAQNQREIALDLHAVDTDSLLVHFMNIALFYQEEEGTAFTDAIFTIENGRLIGSVSANPVTLISRQVKAVTFHNVHINFNEGGYEVDLVLDV